MRFNSFSKISSYHQNPKPQKKMKAKTLLGLTAALAVSLSTWAHAQTIISATSTYTAGPNDISNLTSGGGLNGGQDYSDNYGNGNGAPGQTFTTTTAATLESVTVKGEPGNAGNGYFAATFVLNIYSVSGTTLTALASPQYFKFADQSGATDYSPDYLTLTLATPLALSASTQYAYSFGQYASGGGGYYGFAVSPTAYSGGAAMGAQGQDSLGAGASTANYYGYDRTFSIGLEVVSAPEPATWAMMIGGALAVLGFARFRRSVA